MLFGSNYCQGDLEFGQLRLSYTMSYWAYNGDNYEDPERGQYSINVAPPSRVFVSCLVDRA